MFDLISDGRRRGGVGWFEYHISIVKILVLRAIAALTGERRILSPMAAAALSTTLLPSSNGGNYRRSDLGAVTGADWASALIRARAADTVVVPLAGVVTLENVVVCGEGVICKEMPDGLKIVTETLHNALFKVNLRQIARDKEGTLSIRGSLHTYERLTGPHVCLRQIGDANYGHWLLECLPRMAVVAEHFDLAGLKILASSNSPEMRRVTRDSLACFGIRPAQIVEVRNSRPVSVDHLIYPLPMTIHPWVKAPRVIEILEGIGSRIACGCPAPARLYVSRAGAGRRQLLNEAEVLRVLDPYGFTIVHPERLPFAEQVRMFSRAEVIVGSYGAALTNAVFSPRGVTLFALTTQMMGDDFFWDLINLKGGRYHSLHGPAAAMPADCNSDFRIDTLILRQQISALLGQPDGLKTPA
jgi:capsular polysaccharide biosynthesis protein